MQNITKLQSGKRSLSSFKLNKFHIVRRCSSVGRNSYSLHFRQGAIYFLFTVGSLTEAIFRDSQTTTVANESRCNALEWEPKKFEGESKGGVYRKRKSATISGTPARH